MVEGKTEFDEGDLDYGRLGRGDIMSGKADCGKRYIRHYRELDVYRFAFDAAMRIFQMTKSFPPEERYSLIDQIRRSSRSVCSNIAEGWRKRKYEAVFKNKITDSMQEASETQCWLDSVWPVNTLKKRYSTNSTMNTSELLPC